MGFVLHRKMALVYGYFWVSVSTFLLILLGFLNRVFTRYSCISVTEAEDEVAFANCFDVKDANFGTTVAQGDQLDTKACQEGVADCKLVEETDSADLEEAAAPESPQFLFKFQFQINGVVNTETVYETPKRCEFMSGKGFTQFLEEAEASMHVVKELYIDEAKEGRLGAEAISNSGFLADEGFVHEGDDKRGREAVGSLTKEAAVHLEAVSLREPPDSDHESVELDAENFVIEEVNSLGDHDFISLGSEPVSGIAELKSSVRPDTFTDDSEEMSDHDFDLEDLHSEDLSEVCDPHDFDVEDEDILNELQELQETHTQFSNVMEESCDNNWQNVLAADKGKRPEDDDLHSSQEPDLENKLVAWDSEDSSPLETLWEHQDLIEQLRLELKKVRATGLPTILEESECPKLMEDLKPWKIEDNIHQQNGRINELPKFYKSYRERMRKFDILNYQKMYALGCLQSKEPFESLPRNHSASAFTSLLPHSFQLRRQKKSSKADEPMTELIGELYCDLETVYVGQLCLSWEFLHWQYVKALELWENDPCLQRTYNEVAGEFQQFQVHLQRFIENEPFQGPRVENYTRNRRQMRNLLQVPVIREDSAKDRRARRKGRENDAITSEMLVEMLEESIRTIWQFIRADKHAYHNVNLKYPHQIQEMQNPADADLLKEIRLDLQKKEKKLKEKLKSGHCILRKLQKHQEEETDQFLYFFSQVDMKLARRVLNMSRLTTEQLSWCRTKLNSINFLNRRIHVEPSFLLFPYS